MGKVLVVDDELGVRESIRLTLKDLHEVVLMDSGESALEYLKDNKVEVIFLDIMMPGMSGLETLRIIKANEDSPEIVMVTATRTIDNAVQAMKYGAFEYIMKPFDVDELKILAERAIENRRLAIECAALKRQMDESKERFYKQLEDKVSERTQELEQANVKLRETNEQLVRTEKLASLGELVAGVAHELNNKLLPVLAYSQLLKEQDFSDDVLRYIDTIEKSAAGASAVVSSLLNFARPSSSRRNSVNLNDTMRDTLALLDYRINASSIDVDVQFDENLPKTMVDEKQISQVFLNLVNNAFQAMDKDGGTLAIRSVHEADRIYFTVSDTGCGIPEENLSKIFDPFFSTKGSGGTGLGLSVSYGLISAHGGEIGIDSTVNEGTTFTIQLPVRRASEKEKQDPAETVSPPQREKYKVLVAEDDLDCRSAVSDILKMEHLVSAVENGEEAIRHISKEDFDLVIIDCMMPGLNGFELYKWLLDNRPELRSKVIFMTGDIFVPEIKSFLETTGCPYITKPFAMDDFRRTVNSALTDT
jgi:two-component system NtrC family sensor kinase